MDKVRVFCLVLVTVTFFVLANADGPCYPGCKFFVCSKRGGHSMSKPGMAFTGDLCDERGNRIAYLQSGEARLYDERTLKLTPISKYNPAGLKQKFAPHFFYSTPLKASMYLPRNGKMVQQWVTLNHSGITRQEYQANQRKFTSEKCFVLPFTHWQIIDAKGHVLSNAHPTGDPNAECAAFETMRDYFAESME